MLHPVFVMIFVQQELYQTLQLKIKANSWNKGSAENLHELT